MRIRSLALLTALALVVAACGDSDSSADDATTSTSEAAPPATDGETASSGREGSGSSEGTTFGDVVPGLADESAQFEGTLRMLGEAGSQLTEAIEVPVSGALDPEADASRISVDMSGVAQAALGGEGEIELPAGFAEMFDAPLEVISIGETTWMRFPLLAMLSGADTEWVEVPPEKSGEFTSGLGLGSNATSPNRLLEQLRDAEAQVEEVGTETVRGTETTHYRLQVDVSALAASLPAEEQDDLQQDLGGVEGPLPVEVWVDEDGRLHRYTVDIGGAADDPDVESASITFEFFNHGTDVDIEPPPADEVTPLGELGGLLGGLPGEDGEGTSGSGTSGSQGTGSGEGTGY